MKELTFLVIVILILGFIMYWVVSSDNTYIRSYCAKQNYKVVSIERYIISTGPFSIWTSDETRIYKVTTDRKVVWFRFGWWIDVIEE